MSIVSEKSVARLEIKTIDTKGLDSSWAFISRKENDIESMNGACTPFSPGCYCQFKKKYRDPSNNPNLSMGKSWSSLTVTAATMIDNRTSVVNKLMHYSRKIDNREDSRQETAEFLARCAHELAVVGRLASTTGHLLWQQTARCFIENCLRLETELQSASRELTDKDVPCSQERASLMIEMFAVQIGRLTLDPYGDDEYAKEMNLRAANKEYEWKKRHAQDDDTFSIIRGVFKLSLHLNQQLQFCPCRQCAAKRDIEES